MTLVHFVTSNYSGSQSMSEKSFPQTLKHSMPLRVHLTKSIFQTRSRIYHFLLFAFQLNCITFFDFGIRIKYTAFFFWASFCISPNFNHIDSTLLINFLKTFHF